MFVELENNDGSIFSSFNILDWKITFIGKHGVMH